MSQTGLEIGSIIDGLALPEPLQVVFVQPVGSSFKVGGKGTRTGQYIERIFDAAQLAQLTVLAAEEPFDGDAVRFRLGIEAYRLSLAHEYDPYFSLSVARVDPLPHQLEAVYDAILPLPRIRFLLADDPGAGKTIMAGLLLKELKARGLAARTLIVTPANLAFQWKRELADKFREQFEVVRGADLRAAYGTSPLARQAAGHHVHRLGQARRSPRESGARPLVTFERSETLDQPFLEWITPGHPLFEAVREATWERAQNDLRRGRSFLT
jgi:hypothetical protein